MRNTLKQEDKLLDLDLEYIHVSQSGSKLFAELYPNHLIDYDFQLNFR